MQSYLYSFFLIIPLFFPEGMIETPQGELAIITAIPIKEWYPYWIQKSKEEAYCVARGTKPAPFPEVKDDGNAVVTVDDGTILSKTSFDGGVLGGPTYLLDDFAATRAFCRTHGDDYDSIIILCRKRWTLCRVLPMEAPFRIPCVG